MCSRSIVFEVVIGTIIRGLLFPFFLCITQVPTIAPVRGSLCDQDVYDLGGLALFVTLARSHVFRIGFSTRTPSVVWIEVQVPSQSGHGTTCIQ